jgi:hypothetical protein
LRRKGETAIRIIAPMPIKNRDDDRQSDEDAQPRLLFKAVSVFDTLSRDRWEEHRGSRAAGCLLAG